MTTFRPSTSAFAVGDECSPIRWGAVPALFDDAGAMGGLDSLLELSPKTQASSSWLWPELNPLPSLESTDPSSAIPAYAPPSVAASNNDTPSSQSSLADLSQQQQQQQQQQQYSPWSDSSYLSPAVSTTFQEAPSPSDPGLLFLSSPPSPSSTSPQALMQPLTVPVTTTDPLLAFAPMSFQPTQPTATLQLPPAAIPSHSLEQGLVDTTLLSSFLSLAFGSGTIEAPSPSPASSIAPTTPSAMPDSADTNVHGVQPGKVDVLVGAHPADCDEAAVAAAIAATAPTVTAFKPKLLTEDTEMLPDMIPSDWLAAESASALEWMMGVSSSPN
ncbi:hypothetical protein DFQ26_009607 [Actinomortierella ambigua]|nr:hypothetical protein DFQ26_009607 [Actinomortierella ambigua]